MNREQRQRQMLASLPLLLQEGANLGELCSHLARMMSGEPDDCAIEYGVSRLLRSRWHSLAQDEFYGRRVQTGLKIDF